MPILYHLILIIEDFDIPHLIPQLKFSNFNLTVFPKQAKFKIVACISRGKCISLIFVPKLRGVNSILGAIHKRHRNILGGWGRVVSNSDGARYYKLGKSGSKVRHGGVSKMGQKNSDVFYGQPLG